jgi:hypothetical protein
MRRNRKGKAKISAATISRAPAATANPVVPVIPMIPAMIVIPATPKKDKGKKIIEKHEQSADIFWLVATTSAKQSTVC